MHRVFSAMLLAAGLASCHSPAKLSAPASSAQAAAVPYSPVYNISGFTRLFLTDLGKEEGNASDAYVPSKEIIGKYGLELLGGKYYVKGFIKETVKDPAYLKEAGVVAGTAAGTIRTVLVPLTSLPAFLRLKQISYFEIATKTSR